MGVFDSIDIQNLRRDTTLENLTIPIDYDDDGVGVVGDPPDGTLFVTQADVNNFLLNNGWTAFKHFQAAWNALPTIIGHTITINLATGIHRPRLEDTSVMFALTNKFVTPGKYLFINGSTDYEERISGLTVSAVGTDVTDPWIDFTGTPFAGKDPRGLTLILDTGQKSLIHKFTDSRLYFMNKISPTGPVSGAVGRPATILRNSQKGTETTKHCSSQVIQQQLGGGGGLTVLFISTLTIEQINSTWAMRSGSDLFNFIQNCCIDFASQKDDLGLNPSGSPRSFQSGTSPFPVSLQNTSIRGSLLAETPVGGTGEPIYADKSFIAGSYFYIGGCSDGIIVQNETIASFSNGVIDGGPGIEVSNSSFGGQAGLFLNNGITFILRGSTSYGVNFFNGSFERDVAGVNIRFEDQAGPCIIVDNYSYFTASDAKYLDGGGNLDVGIEVRGSHTRLQLLAGTDVSGALGDMRIEGTIGPYADLPDKTAPLTTVNLNSISKEV